MAQERIRLYPVGTGAPENALVMVKIEGINYAINAREFYMLNQGKIETWGFVRRVEEYSSSDGTGRLAGTPEGMEKRRDLSRFFSPNIFPD